MFAALADQGSVRIDMKERLRKFLPGSDAALKKCMHAQLLYQVSVDYLEMLRVEDGVFGTVLQEVRLVGAVWGATLNTARLLVQLQRL